MRKKRVMRKKRFFFDLMRNGHIFPSKVFHFQCIHKLFFSREMGNIRACKEVRLQKRIKFRLSELHLLKFKLLKNEELFWKSFPIFCKMF